MLEQRRRRALPLVGYHKRDLGRALVETGVVAGDAHQLAVAFGHESHSGVAVDLGEPVEFLLAQVPVRA